MQALSRQNVPPESGLVMQQPLCQPSHKRVCTLPQNSLCEFEDVTWLWRDIWPCIVWRAHTQRACIHATSHCVCHCRKRGSTWQTGCVAVAGGAGPARGSSRRAALPTRGGPRQHPPRQAAMGATATASGARCQLVGALGGRVGVPPPPPQPSTARGLSRGPQMQGCNGGVMYFKP